MRKITTIAASIAATLFLHSAQAQSPEAFSYSGIARNNGQAVANTSIGLQLSILQGSPTGTAVYTETQTTTTDAAGYFAISVGAGSTQSGTFSNVSWGSGNHYLKVAADYSGGTIYTDLGTAQLLSVPYALCAKNVGGLTYKINGVPITDPSLNLVCIGVVSSMATFLTSNNYQITLPIATIDANYNQGDITMTDTIGYTNFYWGSASSSTILSGRISRFSSSCHPNINGFYYLPLNPAVEHNISLYGGGCGGPFWTAGTGATGNNVNAIKYLPNDPAVTGFPNNLTFPLTLTIERQ